ncbi:MAG TPA: ATP-binding protein [Vicinamibacterales bacterium]|nr:ATP-binding protein [Vicinamibacterales bacterium]
MRVIQAAGAYIAVYLLAAWLGDGTRAAIWIDALGPLLPALAAMGIIVARRHDWDGAHAVFWGVIAAGLVIWSIGQVGFVRANLLTGTRPSWLDWHTTFSLVGGGAAPLLAFLARPHRGARPFAVPAITLDVASLSVLLLFVYAFFILAPNIGATASLAEQSLQIVILLQRLLVLAVVAYAAWAARGTAYGRIFIGLLVALAAGFAFRTVLSLEILQGTLPRDGVWRGVLNLAWVIPYFGWAWAASVAPASTDGVEPAVADDVPWWPSALAVAIIPAVGYSVRFGMPLGTPVDDLRDLLTAFATVVGVVLLSARLASQRGEVRRADARARLLAAAVEQTDSLVMVVREDGTIEHANAAMLRALGYDRDSLGTREFAETITSPLDRLGERVERAVRQTGIWRGTFSRRRRDGTVFPVAATVVPLVDSSGGVSHFVGVERDISDDLRVRDELVRAERLSAVGELVAGVAHEINNPLQSIVGCAEILAEGVTDPDLQRDVAIIRAEAGRAREIVRSLLSFVHRRPTQRVATDFNEIIQEAMALRGYHLKQEGIALVADRAAGLPPALASPDEIRQLVLNLLLNAEHAVAASEPPRRITLTTRRADGDAVYLEVRDSGPGVPEQLRHRIFEPFFTTKDVGQGTGLGLSISHGIAQAHGGRLELLRGGPGACFRLVLPVAPPAPAQPAPRPPARAGTEAAEPAAAGVDLHALVVDDEAGVRSLVARLLARRGYRVTQAEDGEAALRHFDREVFDLVLCDVRMPRLNGRRLFSEVEARQPALARRFILMTGDTLSADVAEFSAERGVALLTKPFTAKELGEALARLG